MNYDTSSVVDINNHKSSNKEITKQQHLKAKVDDVVESLTCSKSEQENSALVLQRKSLFCKVYFLIANPICVNCLHGKFQDGKHLCHYEKQGNEKLDNYFYNVVTGKHDPVDCFINRSEKGFCGKSGICFSISEIITEEIIKDFNIAKENYYFDLARCKNRQKTNGEKNER